MRMTSCLVRPFLNAAIEVGAGVGVMGDADHDDAPQGAVGLAVTALVVADLAALLA